MLKKQTNKNNNQKIHQKRETCSRERNKEKCLNTKNEKLPYSNNLAVLCEHCACNICAFIVACMCVFAQKKEEKKVKKSCTGLPVQHTFLHSLSLSYLQKEMYIGLYNASDLHLLPTYHYCQMSTQEHIKSKKIR